MCDSSENLLRPLRIGCVTLKNRVVMAPMTRMRTGPDHTPNALMQTYYSQRAGYGLILTEPTMVQRNYSSFRLEPAVGSEQQVAAWRGITEAVHDKGGVIFLTLYHGGRATTQARLTSPNLVVMGPSREGVPAAVSAHRAEPFPTTVHQMRISEIHYVQECFLRAAKNAMAAGFDGVELDAGNGYLIDQFLRDSSNTRTDEYGGSVENRCRFLLEVVDAVIDAIGKERVSVRLSPASSYNGMSDSDPEGLLAYTARELDERRIAFVDLVCGGSDCANKAAIAACGRANFSGPLVLGGDFSPETAEAAIRTGAADAIAFATLAVANADLVERLAVGGPLNTADANTFLGGGAEGYTDYPLLAEELARQSGGAPASLCGGHGTSPGATAAAPPVTTRPSHASGHPSATRERGTALSSRAPDVGSAAPADKLLRPMLLYQLVCNNRMVMGPLPRQRADAQHNPTPAMVQYYADRSSMGLIVSEPVEIQPGYHTYVQGPCIFTKAQVEGWRRVTEAVHGNGGAIFCQLHHGGRAVAACNLEPFEYGTDNQDGGERSLLLNESTNSGSTPPQQQQQQQVNVISASAHPVPASIVCPAAFAKNKKEEPYPQTVVAVRRAKIAWLVKMYASAARKAMAAGFDGVEVQASNGYLIDQFLRDGSNDRTDEYGGSVENRCRFLLEVVDAVIKAVGKERVGVRVSPTDPALGMRESNVPALCRAVASALHKREVAYLAITNDYALRAFRLMRPVFHTNAIFVDAPAGTHAAVGDCEDMLDDARHAAQRDAAAEEEGQEGLDPVFADLAPPPNDHFAPDAVSFTLQMVANPDLADRVVCGVPLQRERGTLLFTHDAVAGYNDYLTYKEARRRERRAAAERREQAATALEKQAEQTRRPPRIASGDQNRSTSIADEREQSTTPSATRMNRDGGDGKSATTRTSISQPRRVSVSQPSTSTSDSQVAIR